MSCVGAQVLSWETHRRGRHLETPRTENRPNQTRLFVATQSVLEQEALMVSRVKLQIDMQWDGWVGVLVGFGARTVGQLEAGGDAFPNGRAPTRSAQESIRFCLKAMGVHNSVQVSMR